MRQRSKLHLSKVVCRPWAIVVYNVEPTLGQRRNAIWDGVRSGIESLRKIDPLVFDEEVADNFIKFEREWKIYQAAALSEKTKKIQSYILLNLAGADAILKAESFQYTTHESREDPEVLLTKFREQCMPTKNIIIDRHRCNTTNQKPTEPISSYVASLRNISK